MNKLSRAVLSKCGGVFPVLLPVTLAIIVFTVYASGVIFLEEVAAID